MRCLRGGVKRISLGLNMDKEKPRQNILPGFPYKWISDLLIHGHGLNFNLSTLLVGIDRLVDGGSEEIQSRGWNNDGVPSPAHFFGYFQKASPRIFLKIKKELLALDLNPLAQQLIFHDPTSHVVWIVRLI